MIIQGYNYFCDMPEDAQYLRSPQPDERFIEENMVFILPDRLRKFRRHLWHVRRNPGPVHVYVPLFRVNTVMASEPLPAGFGAAQDVYPFYTHTTHRRGRALDYYVVFIFKDKDSYVRCQTLLQPPAQG
ncbi:hypothetical protein GOB86_06605 [Acetobacter lambici]|uniref:Uncharacterized protein n=1 Tax=Acetobacter lambici TaxID=1332824 RepID=A0ABT1EZ70_9PROT|nr:hypothetical protein [Acetobacter lambici]MCP1242225.1 hypothetical protein [Acetobacter lambici]MCP1258242.1 hypothetical protein [Acetobacter lambici]NHO56737.1 hypothetical protein [Acetobacter lambici]